MPGVMVDPKQVYNKFKALTSGKDRRYVMDPKPRDGVFKLTHKKK
jgi:hypothetical protein